MVNQYFQTETAPNKIICIHFGANFSVSLSLTDDYSIIVTESVTYTLHNSTIWVQNIKKIKI